MNVTRESIQDTERRLDFEPAAARRAFAERTPVADADPRDVQRRLAHALGEGPGASDLAIDRIITGSDQLNVNYLERGMIAADAVARLDVRGPGDRPLGFATGFMVSPRLLMTNAHVLSSETIAAESWADFRWEYDAYGRPLEPVSFALDPASFFFADRELDVAVVAVAPRDAGGEAAPASFGWLRLCGGSEKEIPGEWLSVVHHPDGHPKQLTLRQCQLLRRGACHLWYAAGTSGFSSGAPVFNDSWQVVALHAAAVPKRDASGAILTVNGEAWGDTLDESKVLWRAGAGTRISAIVQRVAATGGDDPLVQEMLAEGAADAADAMVIPLGSGTTLPRDRPAPPPTREAPRGNGPPKPHSADAITVTVPLRITVHAENGNGTGAAVGVDVK